MIFHFRLIEIYLLWDHWWNPILTKNSIAWHPLYWTIRDSHSRNRSVSLLFSGNKFHWNKIKIESLNGIDESKCCNVKLCNWKHSKPLRWFVKCDVWTSVAKAYHIVAFTALLLEFPVIALWIKHSTKPNTYIKKNRKWN